MSDGARMNPQDFVAKWSQSTLKERSSYQEHFIDLCRLRGHPTPAELDPSGQSFTFEAGASKQSGGQGFADVWKRGFFAWEYKGKHADLDKAYQQLLQYREALQNPPLMVVSDINSIVIHTNFTNTVKRTYALALDDLLTPAGLDTLRNLFSNPAALRPGQTTEQVTEEAAAQFARLAELLRRYGAEPQAAAHFLIRLLFCLFAEDVGLLPKDLFTHMVHNTRTRPAAFSAQLNQLFAAMSTGGWFGAEEIRHFDGHLFDNAQALDLDSDSLAILAQVGTLDWAQIEPSIFGTLFERSLDPARRAQLGAHYTSREDILLIVEPVLMQPLRRRWEAVQAQARALAAERDGQKQPRRQKTHEKLQALLTGFAAQVGQVQVLDPACGAPRGAIKQYLKGEAIRKASSIPQYC